MGQYAVILTISAILLGGVLLYNARASTGEASDELTAYQIDRLAREAAQIGLKAIVRDLNNRPEAWTDNDSLAHNRFRIPVTNYGEGGHRVDIEAMNLGDSSTVGDIVELTIWGGFESWNTETNALDTTEVTLRAVYERGWVDIGVPPSQREAIQTNEDLDMRGNVCVGGGTHANGDLSTSGGTFDVLGTGTYTTSESSSHDSNFTGGLVQSDSVLIPIVPIPPLAYTEIVDVGGPGNTWTLDQNNDPATTLAAGWDPANNGPNVGFGVAGNPYILYVNGDLEVNGDVHLVGYSQIYVSGEITIGGNSTIAPVPAGTPLPNVTANMSCADRLTAVQTWTQTYLDGGISNMGIYANSTITLGGNINVVSKLTTNAGFSYTGGGNARRLIIGGITAQNALDMRGNTEVYYTESDINTQPGGDRNVPDGIRLVSYREWTERP